MKKNYTFIITEGEDGYLIATVPELPGVMTQAKNIQSLFSRVKEAIEVYLEAVYEDTQNIPSEVKFIC